MKKIIIIISIVLLIPIIFFYFYKDENKQIKIRGGQVDIEKVNSKSEIDNSTLSKRDSSFYNEVIYDYGYYWEAKTSKNHNKIVLFDYNSGKIAVYFNKTIKYVNENKPSDCHFCWEIDSINPYILKGFYCEIEKDTLLFWKYNKIKKEIVDEKGLVYKRKK